MWNQIVLRSILLFLALMCVVLSLDAPTSHAQKSSEDKNAVNVDTTQNVRHRRAVRKPGFFWTLFSVIFEQWADTKNTFSNISRFTNELFDDEREPRVTTTASPDSNASTTQMPFKITRSEFNKILRRNLLGLVRLYNIELRDALSHNDRVNAEFKKNASVEVSKYL